MITRINEQQSIEQIEKESMMIVYNLCYNKPIGNNIIENVPEKSSIDPIYYAYLNDVYFHTIYESLRNHFKHIILAEAEGGKE
ncbi:MAG: hypothetical protein WC438_05895 [Candidatus Pacearchaeota archaeon]